jgi:hypothetical protein
MRCRRAAAVRWAAMARRGAARRAAPDCRALWRHRAVARRWAMTACRVDSMKRFAIRGAVAVCLPARPLAAVNPMGREQVSPTAWAPRSALHARATALRRAPISKPDLPRSGNRHRCCSSAPSRDSRDRDARRCCRACPPGVPRSFAGRRRRHRHTHPPTGSTTQSRKTSARRATLALQSRQQGYETHGTERFPLDPRLTFGETI